MDRDLRAIGRGVAKRSTSYWYRGRNRILDRARSFHHPLPDLAGRAGTTSLDLGCGPDPENPFSACEVHGVDLLDFGNSRIRVADLAVEPIPFPDRSFDFVTAFDFFEHIPRLLYVDRSRRAPFIELMNEIHRVLKPGGILYAQTPAYPRAEAFVDPTHVNTISKGTVSYFTSSQDMPLARRYGFTGNFELIDQYWDNRWYYQLTWQLRAIHD